MFLATIKLFSFLINPEFWSRTGFFVGYIIAFLLVLEVVRLASTDANRKEVERLLDAYAASRNDVPVRRPREEQSATKKVVQVSIDELEDMERRSVIAEQERQTQEQEQARQRTRTPSPAAARIPESKHTEEKRRRRTTSTSASPHATSQSQSQPQTSSSSSPSRRLRKRSDTLNSSSSAEAKGTAVRRRRETSPIESKTRESRHASPTPRSRSKEAKILGGSLGKMLRSRS
jgi:cobalamin biosynthesis Mg chelatase CobN